MHVIFAAISWRRRGFPATDCYRQRQWDMGAPIWTGKQMSKHHPGPRNFKVCLLPARKCWHCFKTLLGPSSSYTRIMERLSMVHGIVLCLKPVIHSKCRGKLTNGVVLHHNNVWPCTATVSTEKMWKLKNKLLLHPAQRPDLSLSDYHIFRLLRDVLVDTNLQTIKRPRMWCLRGFMYNQ
jgi:hypothetical protein